MISNFSDCGLQLLKVVGGLKKQPKELEEERINLI
jgi:hypothetical protein